MFQGERGESGLLLSSGPSWPWSSDGKLVRTKETVNNQPTKKIEEGKHSLYDLL